MITKCTSTPPLSRSACPVTSYSGSICCSANLIAFHGVPRHPHPSISSIVAQLGAAAPGVGFGRGGNRRSRAGFSYNSGR